MFDVRLRRIRPLLAIAASAAGIAAPAAFLHANRAVFGIPTIAINFSWLAILAAGAGLAGAFVILDAAIRREKWRSALLVGFAVLAAVGSSAVFMAYIGSTFSTRAWGDTLTFGIVWEAVRHPWSALDLIGVSSVQRPLVLLGAMTAAVIAFSLLTLLQGFILFELGRATRAAGRGRGRVAWGVGLSLMGCAAVAGGLSLNIALTKPQRLIGEPLLGFVGFSATSNLLTMDSERLLAALQDRDAAASYRVPEVFDKKNVILIFSDAVRADRLEPYGYGRPTTPFLSSLYAAGKLVKVDMALSPCSESFCGIATTLSSRFYHQLSNDNFKLNQVLKKAGYKINYFLSGEHKAWRFLWSFYGNEIDQLINVPTTNDQELVRQFSEAQFSKDTPQFLYFFLMSTHVLGKKLPAFDHYKPSEFSVELLLSLISQRPAAFDPYGVALYPPLQQKDQIGLSNRYDNGVIQTDTMIRDIFDGLDKKGLLKNSIVIFLADHGDGLGERGHVAHARFLYQKDIHVPLLIYDDEQSRYVNREFATLLDVAPTIVQRLGLPIPKSWQGVSLLEPSGPRISLHQTRWREKPCAGVVQKGERLLNKYIRCRWSGRPDSEEVFDLLADPDERVNVVDKTSDADMRLFRSKTAPRFRRIVCPGTGENCVSDE